MAVDFPIRTSFLVFGRDRGRKVLFLFNHLLIIALSQEIPSSTCLRMDEQAPGLRTLAHRQVPRPRADSESKVLRYIGSTAVIFKAPYLLPLSNT